LDVSRILRGKIDLKVYPVNLVAVIDAALETVRLAAEAKGIEIQTRLAPDVGQVSGDAGRLQQVVLNLVSNAVKFTPSGGRVEIRLERVGRDAQIQVIDTGKGIKPEFLPHVFEYFRQEDGKTTRNFGGLGLGLAIVRHLVELHGGTVQAESPGEGQGATFAVRLPLIAIAKEITQDDTPPIATSRLNRLQILVVDDVADMRELLATILEHYGATVRVAASAAEALIAIEQFKPDLLISDIGMSDIDGYMLLRQVRQLPPERGGLVPAIALTAYASEFDYQQALTAGFQKHIPKPVEPEELVKAITALLVEK
jgi:CheY-like chemotaxis protein